MRACRTGGVCGASDALEVQRIDRHAPHPPTSCCPSNAGPDARVTRPEGAGEGSPARGEAPLAVSMRRSVRQETGEPHAIMILTPSMGGKIIPERPALTPQFGVIWRAAAHGF